MLGAVLGLAAVALAGCGTARLAAAPGSSPAASVRAPAGSAVRLVSEVVPAAGAIPRGFRPQSVTFVSAGLGWVLGFAPCSSPPCTSVLRTRDGGRRWRGIPAPRVRLAGPLPGFNYTHGNVSLLRFADSRDGWAFGPDLQSTHDGGAHWHAVSLPGARPSVIDLATAGGLTDAVMRQRGGAVSLYSTVVHADRWRPVLSLPSSQYVGDQLVLHGHAGWVLSTTGTEEGPASFTLYATTDGEHWARRTVPCARAVNDGDIRLDDEAALAAASTRDLILICAGDLGLGGSQKRAYVSHDAGRHWLRRGQPSTGGLDLSPPVAAASPSTAVMPESSGLGVLDGSFDGGRHWREVLSLRNGGEGWSDFGFTTPRQGVAVEATLPATPPMTPGPQFAATNLTCLMDFSALSWLYPLKPGLQLHQPELEGRAGCFRRATAAGIGISCGSLRSPAG